MPIRSVQRARRSGLQFDAASGAGYVLQMWQIRPEDWPLLLWEMDGYSLEGGEGPSGALGDQHVPIILEE